MVFSYGIGLLILVKLLVLTSYPSFFLLRTITATLLRWLLLNLQHSQHYSNTGKRSAFAKALVLQLQSHHFLPCKCYMFSCYRFHSFYCSHFNYKGQKLHRIYNPANKTPQETDNLWKVTTLVVSERERERKEILQSSSSAQGQTSWQWPTSGLKVKVWGACFKISTASL